MKVLFVHCWSNNRGDRAILSSAIRMIRNIDKNAGISVLLSHPSEIDADVFPWPWPVHKPKGLDLIMYPLIISGNYMSVILFRLFGWRFLPFSRSLGEFFDSDIIISPGGDFISPKFFMITSLSEILFAKMLGKKVVILAQSMGPFYGLDRLVASKVIGMCDLIIAREKKTAEHLAQMGIRNVHVTADLAFALDGNDAGKRNGIAMCPKDNHDMEHTVALIDRITKTGRKVVLIPTDSHDAGFQKEIAEKTGVELKDNLGHEDIIRELSGCEFVLSGRMHGAIMAVVAGTPFFAISDGFKYSAVLDDVCPGCVMGMDEFTSGNHKRIIRKIEEKETLGMIIRKNYPEVKKKSKENEKLLQKAFREWGYIK